MATLMDSAAQAISSGIAQASGDIDTILAGSQAKIQTSLSDLRGALSEIEAQSQQEDARVRTIITAITAHIQTSAAHIAEVDKAATDQTSKLAFVVTALGESTRSVGSASTLALGAFFSGATRSELRVTARSLAPACRLATRVAASGTARNTAVGNGPLVPQYLSLRTSVT